MGRQSYLLILPMYVLLLLQYGSAMICSQRRHRKIEAR